MALQCPECGVRIRGGVDVVAGHLKNQHAINVSHNRPQGWRCRQPHCGAWLQTYRGWKNHIRRHHQEANGNEEGSDSDDGMQVDQEEQPHIDGEDGGGENPRHDEANENPGEELQHLYEDQHADGGFEDHHNDHGIAANEGNAPNDYHPEAAYENNDIEVLNIADEENEFGNGDGGGDPDGDDGFSSSSGEGEEDIDENIEQIDIKEAAAGLILNLRSNCNTTRQDVTDTINEVEKVMAADHATIYEEFYELFRRYEMDTYPDVLALLNKVRTGSKPFSRMRSKKGQISAIEDYYKFLPFQTLYLGPRMDRVHVGRGIFRQRPVRATFQSVSLIETLKLVVSQPTIMPYVNSLEPNNDVLENFCDGEQFAAHEFLNRYPDALQLELYYDELEVTNAQGTKCGIHMLAAFYLLILNIPRHLNSRLNAIHVIALAMWEDILDQGFQEVLQPFMNDLAQLESEEGVRCVIREQEITLRASLVAFSGDSKSAHHILGFLGAGARHFCAMCMINRNDHLNGVELGELRTRALHAHHLQLLAQNPNNTTRTGVKEQSCLNNSRFFHCTENFVFDVDHDLAHGIIPMEIRLVLRELICVQHYFTVQDLNRRIRAFNYGVQDIRNKPSANFSEESLRSASTVHGMKQIMAQTYCLLRALPFLLDNMGVPQDNPYLQFLVLLQQAVEMSLAPRIFKTQLPELSALVRVHHVTFLALFPGVNMINKHHHWRHYAECMRKKGPLVLYRTIRSEGKHRPLRRHIVICGSYVSVSRTAMEIAQIQQCCSWGSSNSKLFERVSIVKQSPVAVNTLRCSHILQARGFLPDDIVLTAKEVSVNGTTYQPGQFVIIQSGRTTDSGLHQFALIESVIIANDGQDVWLDVTRWETQYRSARFNAYVVSPLHDAPPTLFDTQILPLHPCLSPWNDYTTDAVYLSLKFMVL